MDIWRVRSKENGAGLLLHGLAREVFCHLNADSRPMDVHADPASPDMGSILCVGIVCLDIINVCSTYPAEDQDVRAVTQRWEKGGNAANSLAVLGQLGMSCHFLGTVAAGPETE